MYNATQDPQWYVARDGKRFGPMSQADLWRLANDGQIKPDDHVWRHGYDDWVSATTIPDLFASLTNAPYQAQSHTSPQEQPAYQPHKTFQDRDIGALNLDTASQRQDQQQNWSNDLRADPLAGNHIDHDSPVLNQHVGHESPRHELHKEPQENYASAYAEEPAVHDTAAYYQQQKSGGVLKKLLYIAAVAIFLIVVAGVAIPFVVPADSIRNQVVRLIKQETGRDVIVRGKTSVTFFPNIGVKLTDITLSNPEGMAGEPLLRMASLTVDLKLIPLFSRQVEFERFILKSPHLSLYIDQGGRKNWEASGFTTKIEKANLAPEILHTPLIDKIEHVTKPTANTSPEAPSATKYAQADTSDTSASSSFIKDLVLGDVQIIDGSVSYADERSGSRQTVSDINIALDMKTLASPLSAEGTVNWHKKTIAIKVKLNNPGAIMNNNSSPLILSVESDPLTGRLEGNITNAENITFTGRITAKSPSVGGLTNWFSGNVETQADPEKLTLSSDVSANSQNIDFEKLNLSLDKATAKGRAKINLTGERPYIQATLDINLLNLNKYFPQSEKHIAKANHRKIGPDEQTLPKQKSLTALIQEINEPGINRSDFKPYAAATGTLPTQQNSENKLAVLKTFDADIAVAIAKIYYQDMSTGQSNMNVKITDGKLTANLKDLQLYGGLATGEIILDANGAVPAFKSSLSIQGVSALPFLTEAASFDWISGRANINIDLKSTGQTKSDIKKNLEGTGSIAFTDGAIEGLNIPQMIRNLQGGKISGISRDQTQKTDFSQFTGSFVMHQGVATNKDLKLIGPLLRATGNGNIDLNREWIDYQITPKLVASLEGQGAADDVQQALEGIEIPVKIQGPWKKPKIIPDTEQILKNPQALAKGIEAIGQTLGLLKKKKITGKDFEAIINNVLGNKNKKHVANQQKATDESDKQNQALETNKLLKELLAQ